MRAREIKELRRQAGRLARRPRAVTRPAPRATRLVIDIDISHLGLGGVAATLRDVFSQIAIASSSRVSVPVSSGPATMFGSIIGRWEAK